MRRLVYVYINLFILTQCLFGKEADKLERDNDDEKMYYIIEKEPLINKFISVPAESGTFKRPEVKSNSFIYLFTWKKQR